VKHPVEITGRKAEPTSKDNGWTNKKRRLW